MESSNIMYVEPNYLSAQFNSTNNINEDVITDMTPNLEDYCIFVNLEVEDTDTFDGYTKQGNKTISLQARINKTENSDNTISTSILKGTKIRLTNSLTNEVTYENSLTTNAYEYSTYTDVVNGGSNECIGIKSIDITYNNYMVPEVVINFTDIRGLSLFANEELKRTNDFFNESNENLINSFFRSYFTKPNSKFKLTIKGFYGSPVSYELMCADFRAKFNSSSGDFEATVKFVGFTQSFLSDITMNAIVAAPYSNYCGKEYWTNKIKEDFVINGKPMPTIIEILDTISNLQGNQNNTLSRELTLDKSQIEEKINAINTAINNLNLFFNQFITSIAKLNLDGTKYTLYHDITKGIILIFSTETQAEISIKDETLKNVYNTFYNSIKSLNSNIYIPNYQYNDNITLKNVQSNDIKSQLLVSPLSEIIKSYSNKNSVFIYNINEIIKYLNNEKLLLNNKVSEYEMNLANDVQDSLSQILGFSPTVENITRIILAHLETLIHCFYFCENEIKNSQRTKDELGLNSTDTTSLTYISPFPKVNVNSTDSNGINNVEEGWIGSLTNGKNQPEVNFIDGMLDGIKNIEPITNKALNVLLGNSVNDTKQLIPVVPLDLLKNMKNPFYSKSQMDFNDFSSFAMNLGIRLTNVIGLNSNFTKYDEMGKIDAHNFALLFPKPNNTFINRLKNNIITSELIYNSLSNEDVSEQINGKWSWDSWSNSNTEFFKNQYYNWLNAEEDGIKKLILSSDEYIDSSTELYFYTNIEDERNVNLSEIYGDYNSLSNLTNQIQLNGKQLSYANQFKLTLDINKYKKYFEDDSNAFALKFSSSNKEGISYEIGYQTVILPKEKNDANFISNVFYHGQLYSYDFDEINCKNGNGIKKYKRKNNSFRKCIEEIGNLDNYTIPSFSGFRDGDISNYTSIFGQLEYYAQTNKYVKALLFLETLRWEDNHGLGENDKGGLKYNDYILNDFLDDKQTFIYMPYSALLLTGGYLWLWYDSDNGKDSIVYLSDKNLEKKYDLSITNNEVDNRLLVLPKAERNKLIKKFTDWVEDVNGFGIIQENLELHKKDGTPYDYASFKQLMENRPMSIIDDINFVDWLTENFDEKFFKNYISLRWGKRGVNSSIKLFNRETSSIIQSITQLYITPVLYIKTINNKSKNIKVNKDDALIYLNNFLSELKTCYSIDNTNNTTNTVNVQIDENLRIGLYKYFKILWDNWLNNNVEEKWHLSNLQNSWFYIDAYYNKIGQDIMINMSSFCKDIIFSQQHDGYSLLSFLATTYAKDRFNFFCIQNFMDLVDGIKGKENMNKLFKPIPYNEIDFGNINVTTPNFILMYGYEPSSKLNIENGNFQNDSFDINGDIAQLPLPIVTKNSSNGYKIPAFGVAYGRQYQHYFTDIDVSMDNPIVTDQVLKANYMIASMYNKNGENGKNIIPIGQDLFSIYSNNSYSCSVKMLGCAWIQPLMYFQLLNVPLFKGAYIIQEVSHHIEPGNMITSFKGMRLPNVATKKIKDSCIIKLNNEDGATYDDILLDQENRHSDVNNNCRYKFFMPLSTIKNKVLTNEILNYTLEEYSNYVQTTWDSLIINNHDVTTETVSDLLASCIIGEAGNQDKLGQQLVATVIFNRYVKNDCNLTKIFYGEQIQASKTLNYYRDKGFTDTQINQAKQVANSIFTQSPAIIVNEQTNVLKSVKIWNQGQSTNEMTENKTITLHDLQVMDGYCTTKGYDVQENATSCWHKSYYILQHDNVNENIFGHVFVATSMNEIWINDTSSNNEKISLLFDCIKKSIEYSDNINIKNIIQTKIDENSFYITCDSNNELINVFDVILNTYDLYIEKLYWVTTENNISNYPDKIYVKMSNNYNDINKRIGVVTINNNNFTMVNDYQNLNSYFYMSIKKYYNQITAQNSNEFKKIFTNFITLTQETDWINKMNNILNSIELTNCINIINNTDTEGYTWEGVNSEQNKRTPLKEISELNPNLLANYCKKQVENAITESVYGYSPKPINKSLHHCAEWVREGLEYSCGKELQSYPLSACVYSKFLPSWGFTEIISSNSRNGSYEFQNGDIAVVAGKIIDINNDNENSRNGHIHVYNNGKWYSDFECKTPWVYSDEGRPYKVYRKNNLA